MKSIFNDLITRKDPLIIAEIGAKYAEMDTMLKMVNSAKMAGADWVKFQTYTADTISTPGSFFTFEDGSKVSQYDFFKAYELTYEDHLTLDNECKKLKLPWISTPSHVTDLNLLEKFDPIAYKTGSDDLTNTPFLKKIAEKKRPMIVSTGMCELWEIEKAIEAITNAGNSEIVLLHCVVSYPAKIQDANLKVITTLQNCFGLPVGLSDHTQDEMTSIMATQLGACIIEKHFTLDHALKLPDHQASLDPAQFKILCDRVKMVNTALGNGHKRILSTEEKWRKAARKSIFSKGKIPKGTVITEDMLEIRRPSEGLHPHHIDIIIGRKAQIDIAENSLLDWTMV